MKRLSPRTASVRRIYLFITVALLAGITFFPGRSVAQTKVLEIDLVTLDRPTIHMLGVQMLITGDDDRDAKVTMRYRPIGQSTWRDGLPLLRVFPETVSQQVPQPPQQFAGSLFDLLPDTWYEIELLATDPDGPVVQTAPITGKTRPVPRQDPVDSNIVNVTPLTFQSALNQAAPGDVIILANGTYQGTFALNPGADGTPENPIVIRGESAIGVVLDGGNCSTCNVLDIYRSYVHVENLTIRNAFRALKFQGIGTRNNVARRLQIQNVIHGISQGENQLDFYISDNVIEGRVTWPQIFAGLEGEVNAPKRDWRGIAVHGDGHVVCHNRVKGFGDPVINMKLLARSIDFYGNDILNCFDGTELDTAGGNVRAIGNRFTNVWSGISLQPIHGGPAYVMRNVFLNVVNEQIKLKSLGGVQEPSGVRIYHNTFVSPKIALNLQANLDIKAHNFAVMNNLFVGPRVPNGRTVEWIEELDPGSFNFNGYFPEGAFWLGQINEVDQKYDDFGDLKSSGLLESGGTLLRDEPDDVPPQLIFAGGLVGPAGNGSAEQNPGNFNLASTSDALNRGAYLPGVNVISGGAPDLGALESGCATPTYGPRPEGNESIVAAVDCRAPSSLPSLWANRDIGSVGLVGSSSYSNGTFTVNGSGADIWDVADEFHFVYRSLSGDGQIVARVASVENTDLFAKAGVMIRETLTPGSRHVILDIKPGGGLEFMSRSTTGGSTSVVNGGTTVPIPYWLKLVRSGNTFTASRSSDGINWTAVGSGTTVSMASNVYVGLAVTSHNNTVLNTSTFNNVSVTPQTDNTFWANQVGVTVNSSGGLTKTGTTAAWDAGAYSVQALTGDGYVEFSTDERFTGKMCGLTATVAGQHYSAIRYTIGLGGANFARIYENGTLKGTFAGEYQPGQRYRVSVEGSVVKYYKDGVAHSYTGSVSPTHSLQVDTSIFNPGATITDVVFFSKLTWTNPIGVTVNSSNGLTKTGTTAAWDAGAYSAQALTGDGYVEFSTDERFTGKMCGLTATVAGQNYTAIRYTIGLGGANFARIYENGTLKGTFPYEYQPGQRYRVSIEGTVVKYYQNGVAHSYTGSVSSTHSLQVDTSIFNTGATITDAVISGAWGD